MDTRADILVLLLNPNNGSMFSRRIPILLFLLQTISVMGQAIESAPSPVKRKMQWGISASLDYTNRVLTNKTNDADFDDFIALHNKEEIGSLGYRVGGDLHFPLGKRNTFIGGISLTRLGYQTIKDQDLHWPDEMMNGEYVPDPTRNDEIQFFYRFYYIDVPLSLQVYWNETTPWFFTGGITTNFFLNATSTQVYTLNGNTDRRTRDFEDGNYSAINLTPQIGLGRDFKLTPQLHLQIASVFNFGLIPIYADKIAANTWSAGLTMKLLFGGTSK
jgi:hypothetical protein